MKIFWSVNKSAIWLILSILLPFNLIAQTPPPIKKTPKIFKEFGKERIDNYYWMNERDSVVIEHLKRENEYASAILESTTQLQEKLISEILEREAAGLPSLPVTSNGYVYYDYIPEGQQYPVYFRRKIGDTEEAVVQDFNLIAKGHSVLKLQKPVISPNNNLALISIDTKGNNRFKVLVKDIDKGTFLEDTVYDKTYNFPVWAPDNKSFYYVQVDSITMRPSKVKLHSIGKPSTADDLIFKEKDSLFYLYLQPSGDRRYLFINSYNLASSGVKYIDLINSPSEVMTIEEPEKDIIFHVIDHFEDDVLVYTNHSAPNFRVVRRKLQEQAPENWKDVIPESNSVYLEPYPLLVKRHLITKKRKDGVAKLNVVDLTTAEDYDILLDSEIGFFDVILPANTALSDSIGIAFSSYAVPDIEYSYNLKTRQLRKIRQKEIPGFNPEDYRTEIIQVKVRDSVFVPVSMVYNRKAYKRDGKHPMRVETYSWYNFANDPYFSSELISLLDRGVIFAYPHARGGAEKGPSWWNDGRRLNRMNTFFDVIDCAKYLIAEKYTSSEKIVATGRSAGATNIGAIINLEPDLFKAVVAEVPWLDVLTDMQNSEVPGIALEYEEEGNPHIPEEYNYMSLWSPYDNVEYKKYPAVFATAAWNDNNVPYYHAAKWVAKLREHNLGDEPVILQTNLDAGHSGNTGKYNKAKATALKFAYILNAVGITE